MKTKIEWTDATWNPVSGCDKVSAGCKNCYAETIANRFWKGRKFTDVKCHPERLNHPLKWKKPQRIFVNSMSDLFHKDVPDEFILKVFKVMSSASQHTFQVLTKRPERMRNFMGGYWDEGNSNRTINNIWLGVSVEDQKTADERIPILLQTEAAIKFVSAEPLLDKINLEPYFKWKTDAKGVPIPRTDIDWVICGGESGKGARPMHPKWPELIRDQCVKFRVPFFFKQWGEYGTMQRWREVCDEEERDTYDWPAKSLQMVSSNQDFPSTSPEGWAHMLRLGKKKSGRTLDGKEWSEFPK